MGQKRHKRRADHGDGDADDEIRFTEKRHQRLDLFLIPLGQRLIEAVNDGGADAQLHKGKSRENAGKKTVKPQIFFGQQANKEYTRNKTDQNTENLTADAHKYIF